LGTLAKDLTAGSYELDISYAGITVVHKSGDVCTFSPTVKCPQAAGDVTVVYTVNVPSIAPAGKYTATLKATHPDSSLLFCVSVDFEIDATETSVVIAEPLPVNTGVPFSTCGSGDLTATSLDITPYPPVPGKDVTITALGSLAQDLTAGSYDLDISYAGITVVHKTGDVCTFSPTVKCPQAKGDVEVVYTVNVPSIAPAGAYVATLKATHPDSSVIFCVTVNFDISGDEAAYMVM
jgi:hypothetical protein